MNNKQKYSLLLLLKFLLSTLSVIFLLLIAQNNTNLLFKSKHDLNFADNGKNKDLAYFFSVPKKLRSANAKENSYVLHNNKPLQKSSSLKDVRKFGQGRYNFSENRLYYSKPLHFKQGDTLTAVMPKKVKGKYFIATIVLSLLTIILYKFNSNLSEIFHIKKVQKNTAIKYMIFAFIVLLCLLVRINNLDNHHKFNLGTFYIKGLQYSDACGWNELSWNLKHGKELSGNFEGNRPFYAVFTGFLYSMFGDSVLVAKISNALIFTLALVIIYLLLQKILGVILAVVVSVYLIFSGYHLEFVNVTLTEPLSFSLGLMAFSALFWAIFKKNKLLLLLSGGVFGFSNLTQTITIFQLPLYTILIFWYFRFYGHKNISFFRGFLASIIFCVGAFLVFTPWMIRQKIKHGAMALSFSGIEVLYGGTTEEKKYNANIYKESLAAGVHFNRGERYRFFAQKYKDNVFNDFFGYIKFVGSNAKRFLSNSFENYDQKSFSKFLLLTAFFGHLCFLANVFSANRYKFVFALSSCLIFLYILLDANLLSFYLIILYPFFLWFKYFFCGQSQKRLLVELLIIYGAGVAFLCGLMGDFSTDRFVGSTNWIVILLGVLSLIEVANLVFGKNAYKKSSEGISINGLSYKFAYANGFAVSALCILASITIFAKVVVFAGNNVNAKTDDREILTLQTRKIVDDWVSLNFPEISAEARRKNILFVKVVNLVDNRCFIGAKEEVGHWSRLFEERDLPRLCAYVRLGTRSNFSSSYLPAFFHPLVNASSFGKVSEKPSEFIKFPKSAKAKKDYVLVAVKNFDPKPPLLHDKLILESLALIPFAANSATVDLTGAVKFKLYQPVKFYRNM